MMNTYFVGIAISCCGNCTIGCYCPSGVACLGCDNERRAETLGVFVDERTREAGSVEIAEEK
jgi:hypothetical protein